MGTSNHCGRRRKVLTVSHILSSTADLLPKDLRFEHGGRSTCFLSRTPSNLVTPLVREEFCRDFGPLRNIFFLREVNKMWRKAKAFSAFLGNGKAKETVDILADIVYHHNDFNAKFQGEKHSLLLLIWSPLLALSRKSLISSNKSFKTNLVILRGIRGKYKQEDSRYIQLIEKLITNIVEQFGDFLFENSCCSCLKTLFSDRHYRILNWSKKTHAHVCTEDEVQIFIGTGALLGIFAYICRQQPILHCIHWWRWRSGAPAAWHHWCGRSQNSIGINWIPIECSSERNIFWWHTWELLVKGRHLQKFFHSSQIVSGKSYGVWVYMLLLEGRIVPSCQLQ